MTEDPNLTTKVKPSATATRWLLVTLTVLPDGVKLPLKAGKHCISVHLDTQRRRTRNRKSIIASKFITNPMTTQSQRRPSSLWMGLTRFLFLPSPTNAVVWDGRAGKKREEKKKKLWMQQFLFCFLTPLSFLPTIFQLEGVMC